MSCARGGASGQRRCLARPPRAPAPPAQGVKQRAREMGGEPSRIVSGQQREHGADSPSNRRDRGSLPARSGPAAARHSGPARTPALVVRACVGAVPRHVRALTPEHPHGRPSASAMRSATCSPGAPDTPPRSRRGHGSESGARVSDTARSRPLASTAGLKRIIGAHTERRNITTAGVHMKLLRSSASYASPTTGGGGTVGSCLPCSSIRTHRPHTSAQVGCARSSRAPIASASGRNRSSASRKTTASPVVCVTPAFLAEASPLFGCRMHRTSGYRRATAAVSSVDPSSTTTISAGRSVCASTLSSASRKKCP